MASSLCLSSFLLFVLSFVISLSSADVLHGNEEAEAVKNDLYREYLREEAISRLNELGRVSDVDGYLERTFMSPASIEAGNIIRQWMEDAGLRTWVDHMGNVHGRVDGMDPSSAALLMGSHYDTVVDAGKFDGALGIVSAISALKALKVNGKLDKLRRPVEDHILQRAVVLGKEDKGLCLHTGLRNKVAVDDAERSKQIDSVVRLPPGFVACLPTSEMWHFRLGHTSFEQMKCMNLPSFNKKGHSSVCQICPMAKMHRLPFPLSCNRASKLFELLHVDIWGPHPHSTHNGCKFFLTIVDDFSRSTWVHLLSHKSNATPLLKTFIVFVERQFDAKVKVVRSYNGMEFHSDPIKQFYDDKGVMIQSSCVDTPQQNGVVERKHQQLFRQLELLCFRQICLQSIGEKLY